MTEDPRGVGFKQDAVNKGLNLLCPGDTKDLQLQSYFIWFSSPPDRKLWLVGSARCHLLGPQEHCGIRRTPRQHHRFWPISRRGQRQLPGR